MCQTTNFLCLTANLTLGLLKPFSVCNRMAPITSESLKYKPNRGNDEVSERLGMAASRISAGKTHRAAMQTIEQVSSQMLA